MIKILIIEDNIEKLRKINSFLNEICNVMDEDISYASNIQTGREYLMHNQYDLLLLDLVLPLIEYDEPSKNGGSQFLDEIYYNPNINIPVHIIGLTEFDDIFCKYHEQFDDKLWSLINFNLSNTDWAEKLKSKIFYLQSFKKRYENFIEYQNKYDIVILTALNSEFEQLIKAGKLIKLENDSDTIVYYHTIINSKNNNNIKIIACCINQMGMQASAAVASKVISLFSPKQLYITGICAGIKENGVNIGDIIIASQCWDYETGKISEDSNGSLIFKPEIHSIPTEQSIISQLTDFSNSKNYLSNISNDFEGTRPDTQLSVKFGPVGSGPYVLSNKQYLKELISTERKLLGIDMEGYGIYKAAQFHIGTLPVFIKAVSDFGDKKKNNDFQNYASFVSAKFIIDYIYNCQ
jgi:nucleoside phosphorylase/CheY-like chemotaxis protein